MICLACSAANGKTLADETGRWSCTPIEPLAPQIEIDFAEQQYRRCDQNICSAYDLTVPGVTITATDTSMTIEFAPQSRFRAARDSAQFVETLTRGARRIVATGSCRFHPESPT